MKKIALVHMAYPPNTGGVEILLREHAIALTDLGFEVGIFTGSGEEKDSRIKLTLIPQLQSVMVFNPALQAKMLEQGNIDSEFYQLSESIGQKLEEYFSPYDVIIVHNMLTVVRNLPFTFAFKKYLEKHPEKKYIAWVHDHSYIHQQKIKNLDEIVKSKFERDLMTTPLSNVTYVTISEVFKKALVTLMNMPETQIHVIYNGINVKRFLEIDEVIWSLVQRYDLLSSFPLILQPVNLLGRKNIEYSIDILSSLSKDFPTTKLLITGNPSRHRSTEEYMTFLKNRIADLKLDSSVIFLHEFMTTSLAESALHDLYSLSDLIFYFSKSENFGLPLLEAALAKTPIFVSNLEVFREIGSKFIEVIDYETIPAPQAAEQVKAYLHKSRLITAHQDVRTKYNLVSMLQVKLLPLFI